MSNEINNDPNWESRCNKDDLVLNGPSKIKRVYDIILFVPVTVERVITILHLCGVVDLQSLQERATNLFGIIL
jgi:hypothetical protein